MSPLGHIVDMVMMDLGFMVDSIKKKSAKGGQTVLCMDYGRFLICAYMHRHNNYNHNKQGWSDAGPYELYILQCALL